MGVGEGVGGIVCMLPGVHEIICNDIPQDPVVCMSSLVGPSFGPSLLCQHTFILGKDMKKLIHPKD